jgi:hypothetical protein
VNTTRLLRRVSRYLEKHSGGRKQTGETSFGINSCQDGQVLRRIRQGREVGQEMLKKIDQFLTDAGY